MVHFRPLFGPFWVQKSSWSLIVSSLPYFNILLYPNVTSLSCKGGASFSFCIFCIRVAPAFLDWSWARCDEHVTIELHTQKCMYVCMFVCLFVCPDVRLFWPKFIQFCLHTVWGTPLPFGECFKPKKIDPPRPLCPRPLFLVFWGDFSRNFGTQVLAHLRPCKTLARRFGLIETLWFGFLYLRHVWGYP